MRVLLSDGWSLAARQTATILGQSGHEVETLGGSGLSLCRHTRWISHVHSLPGYGRDPLGWLSAASDICARQRIRLLIPTQEQAAVLSAFPGAIRSAGGTTRSPIVRSAASRPDKVSAARLLTDAGVPQPEFVVVRGVEDLLDQPLALPVYIKAAIGTASVGVRAVATPYQLIAAAQELADRGLFTDPVLVQRPVDGPLVMIQSVFADGELHAHHVNLRLAEGAGGGASRKESARLPVVEAQLRRLGQVLRWHGALSLDCILTPAGPSYIDINPRLVEPMNALHSREELPPPRHDPRTLIPPAVVALGRMARPALWQRFATGATQAYALTPEGWREIIERYVGRVGRVGRVAAAVSAAANTSE